MAGRPRRRRASSTSTTAPLDHPQIRWTKESLVLKPAPQHVPDSEWPCYVLTDATIYRSDGKTLANPLLVHLEGPLIVRGLLEVDEDKLVPNLVRSSVRAAYIEIPRSDRYSIGDGPLVLWVSGAAGWFEIRPSARYLPMYEQVREAITLYYSAFEVYEAYAQACGGKKKSRRPPPPSLDEVFLKYAVRAGDGILRHEVEALCHKWADFLIPHFDKEVDLDWNTTRFAKWLRDSHPDVQKRLADIARRAALPPPPPSESQESSSRDQATGNRGSRSARSGSRSLEVEDGDMRGSAPSRSRSPQSKSANRPKPRTSGTPVSLPEKYRQLTHPISSKSSPAPAETPKTDTPRDTPTSNVDHESSVDRLLEILNEVASEVDIKKAAPSRIHSAVYFKCKVRAYSGGKDILAYYAKDLLPRLGPEWKGTMSYQWLADAAKRPWKPTEPMDPDKIPAQTLRREKSSATSKASSTTRPATQLPPAINLKAKTKSALQHDSDSEAEFADLYAGPQRGRSRSGKAATLRLATSSKKRPRSDLDDQANGGHRSAKTAKVNHLISDEDDLEDDVEDKETGDDEVAAGEETLVDSRLPVPEGAVRVVVHAERLPTTVPSGPDGTWTCDQEGCTYVVRSADEQEAQDLIREHFRDHEAQAEKISLAVRESRGQMPIKYAYFPPILLLVHMHNPSLERT
ncbi:hypothetical protein MYCTH_2302469 [Thermothelomyces thermophilus ATCC 42464]|uniref:Uncharacterized protein n=1 Tax=Thermothelomyces thermophilus (strain ATCC 42464 / BCRC 31852 / DSM 1799) TaxID=573729 RepID=G2Q7S7_THET4|nr:uncharacterized protein MYCTH_2302469 [Thermothelomyces thermophilus ATCC 42464]AEO56936.1 hypothetical protein MYCTH_2302469 [Thermothelomyces thermophilus ATCC 42464]